MTLIVAKLHQVEIKKKGVVTVVCQVKVATDQTLITVISPRGAVYHRPMHTPQRILAFHTKGAYVISDGQQDTEVIV